MKLCNVCKKRISDISDMNKTPSGVTICNTCYPEWERTELIRLSHKKTTRRKKRSYRANRTFNK